MANLQAKVEELQKEIAAAKEKYLANGRLEGYEEDKKVGAETTISEYFALFIFLKLL
ncbi:hypothetical protein L484_026872 [Morus notabilis]|uniref:Uncharacterized protein n=1 Tax=Morus notabilis TaxID=981085 RepID=W9RUM1_9ROSA|nr:hypothetical protein L484_026872 [Morus notabilis]